MGKGDETGPLAAWMFTGTVSTLSHGDYLLLTARCSRGRAAGQPCRTSLRKDI